MSQKKAFPIPVTLLLLDIAGAILVAWGFYRYVGGGGGIPQIIAGFLLMAPMALHFLRIGGEKRRSSGGDK